MRKLIEIIGKREGFDVERIHKNFEKINLNITRLARLELEEITTYELITIAIEYSLNSELQEKYENILTYVKDIL